MKIQIKNKILFCVLLLLSGFCNLCFANPVETQLSADQVTLGDSIFITYILNNTTASTSPDFSSLQTNFNILNSNYGKTVNMVNGVTTIQTFWRLQLQPTHAGNLIIPEIDIAGNKSSVRNVVVTTNSANQATQNNSTTAKQSIPVYVRGEISSTSPYLQSQMLYSFKLYFRTQLRDPRVELPQIKDAAIIQLEDSPVYQTAINGKEYNVIERNFALFPKKPGAMTIAPVKFHAVAIEQDPNSFGDPFSFYEPKVVSLTTKDFNVKVRDVPTNYQGAAWLPAKNLVITEQWSDHSQQWAAGTPVTRTITVEAEGLRAEQLPDLVIDQINGVNVYVDKPKRTNTVRKDIVVGVYEQRVTYIPNSNQTFAILPVKINWWNLQTDTNAVAHLNGMTVLVKATGASSSSSNNVSNSTAAISKSTAITSPATQANSAKFYQHIWFWVASCLFVGWMVTLWLMLRKKPSAANKTEMPAYAFSEKNFAQACHAGQAKLAQQYLLSWAKIKWPNTPLNLASLREIIRDETFANAALDLEKAIYATQAVTWNGEALYAAFQRIKKTRKAFGAFSVNPNNASKQQLDPLPPLNPEHAPKKT